jgi:hypothetical protein
MSQTERHPATENALNDFASTHRPGPVSAKRAVPAIRQSEQTLIFQVEDQLAPRGKVTTASIDYQRAGQQQT